MEAKLVSQARGRRSWALGWMMALLAFLVLVPNMAPAIPQFITISGRILTPEGAPPLGTAYPGQVRLWASETSPRPINTIEVSVTVTGNVFQGRVFLPGEVLLLDELWYSFAIDLDNNGLTDEDYFGKRYQLTSVPFSLTGKPASFFETHGGTPSRGGVKFPYVANTVFVCPFTTPPAGVKFNRLSIRVIGYEDTPQEAKIMAGIYDFQGNLLYTTPVVAGDTIPRPSGLMVWEVEGGLEPSTIYYTALWSNDWRNFGIRQNPNTPSVPTAGVLFEGGDESGLKMVLDFENINPDIEFHPLSIGLYVVDETSPLKMSENLGKGIVHDKGAKE